MTRASDAHCLEIAWEVASTDCDELQDSDLYAEVLSSVTDFGDGSGADSGAAQRSVAAQCSEWTLARHSGTA